jgi:hypothetical protein
VGARRTKPGEVKHLCLAHADLFLSLFARHGSSAWLAAQQTFETAISHSEEYGKLNGTMADEVRKISHGD